MATKKITLTELKSLVREMIKEEYNKPLNENFEVHYSDGIRARKIANSLNQAISIANDLTTQDGMKFVDIYKADSGFHSTADDKYLVKWWGKNSYWDNMSKKYPELLQKKLEVIK